jgi:enoyl-CoA hydratase
MALVEYEEREGIAVIRMDDGKANALGHKMLEELEAATTRAIDGARALLLTGREGRFSAGFDLQEMMGGVERARALVTRGGELLLRLYMAPLPVVVACTGHALAGGALLVLTADLRVCARGAFRIGLNEVQIGLPVPILAMELARDRLRPSHLTAATLFGAIHDPDQAVAAGWVDEVVDADALMARALSHAGKLAALNKGPYANTKNALRERTVRYIREHMDQDMDRLLAR